MRTIRVTGKGQIKVKPDMTHITMTLEGLFKDYGETLRHSSEDTEELKDVLSAFGFERADLKTLKERSFIDFVNKMQLSQCVIQAFAHSKLSLDNALDNR